MYDACFPFTLRCGRTLTTAPTAKKRNFNWDYHDLIQFKRNKKQKISNEETCKDVQFKVQTIFLLSSKEIEYLKNDGNLST